MNDPQKGEKTTFQKFKTGFGRKKQEVFVQLCWKLQGISYWKKWEKWKKSASIVKLIR